VSGCPSHRVLPLSHDHKPDSPNELKRIEAAGGYVRPAVGDVLDDDYSPARIYRIKGQKGLGPGVTMSRSLGDLDGSGCGMLATPDVITHTVDPNVDDFLILASDGVWEFVDSEAAVNIVAAARADGKPAHEACRLLITRSALLWKVHEGDYRDDISAVVVYLPEVIRELQVSQKPNSEPSHTASLVPTRSAIDVGDMTPQPSAARAQMDADSTPMPMSESLTPSSGDAAHTLNGTPSYPDVSESSGGARGISFAEPARAAVAVAKMRRAACGSSSSMALALSKRRATRGLPRPASAPLSPSKKLAFDGSQATPKLSTCNIDFGAGLDPRTQESPAVASAKTVSRMSVSGGIAGVKAPNPVMVPISPTDDTPPDTISALCALSAPSGAPMSMEGDATRSTPSRHTPQSSSSLAAALHSATALSAGVTRTMPAESWAAASSLPSKPSPAGSLSAALQQAAAMVNAPPPAANMAHNWSMTPSPSSMVRNLPELHAKGNLAGNLPGPVVDTGWSTPSGASRAQSAMLATRPPLKPRNTLAGPGTRPVSTKGRWGGALKQVTALNVNALNVNRR